MIHVIKAKRFIQNESLLNEMLKVYKKTVILK